MPLHLFAAARAALKLSLEWWNFTSGPSRSTTTSTITDCDANSQYVSCRSVGRAQPAQPGLGRGVADVEVEDDVRLGERPALVEELRRSPCAAGAASPRRRGTAPRATPRPGTARSAPRRAPSGIAHRSRPRGYGCVVAGVTRFESGGGASGRPSCGRSARTSSTWRTTTRTGEPVTGWPDSLPESGGACRPAGGHPPAAPGPDPGDRGGDRGRARDLRAHRPPRPRRAEHGRRAGLLPPGPQRRLAARRGSQDRPERAHGGRGAGAVPRRRHRVEHAGGEGGPAQAGTGVARDVPHRGRSRRQRRRRRPDRLGALGSREDHAGASRRAPAGGRRRSAGAARLRHSEQGPEHPHRPPARARDQERSGTWWRTRTPGSARSGSSG